MPIMDTNGDGVVSAEEARKYKRARKEGFRIKKINEPHSYSSNEVISQRSNYEGCKTKCKATITR